MKTNKLFIGLASLVAAVGFTACSNDDAGYQQSLSRGKVISLTSQLQTMRSTTDPQAGTSLSTNSALAVWAINNTTAITNGDNEQYSVDGSGNLTPNTAANTMTWPDGATLNFYAYAPYNSSYSYNEANSFSVQTDQSSAENYLASDLVLAQTTNKTYDANTSVSLSFKHLLSKINITVSRADGATIDLTNAKVTIMNTQITTTFKPSATDEDTDKILGSASGDATDIVAANGNLAATGGTACAILIPQTIAANTELVKIETNPGQNDNRTLIAKITAGKELESGQAYNFTVNVADPVAPVTYVDLEFGTTTLIAWGTSNIGSSTREVYGVGDYIMNDGTFIKGSLLSMLTDETKSKISAVIFSTESHDSGWDGYAVSVCGRKGSQTWQAGDNITASILGGGEAITDITGAVADFTGLAVTQAAQAANYTSAFSFSTYKGQSDAKNISSDNLSDWFMPSVGQLIELFKNLGGASSLDLSTVTWTGAGEISDNKPTGRATIISTINGYNVTATDIIEAVDYCTTTQSADDKMWVIKLSSGSDDTWNISKSAGKTGNSRNVLPILAFKQPTE